MKIARTQETINRTYNYLIELWSTKNFSAKKLCIKNKVSHSLPVVLRSMGLISGANWIGKEPSEEMAIVVLNAQSDYNHKHRSIRNDYDYDNKKLTISTKKTSTMTIDEMFNKALHKMPKTFSTNNFSVTAQVIGVSYRSIANGEMRVFLETNCEKGSSQRMWVKKNLSSPSLIPGSIPIPLEKAVSVKIDTEKLNEQNAIRFLKELGYKIMQPTFNEL